MSSLPRILLLRNGNFIFKNEGKNNVQNIYKRLISKAGIDRKLTPHSARKSFATLLREKRVGVYEIEQLLNHSVNSLGANTYARMTKELKIEVLKNIKY